MRKLPAGTEFAFRLQAKVNEFTSPQSPILFVSTQGASRTYLFPFPPDRDLANATRMVVNSS
jgi:hypothetical protein